MVVPEGFAHVAVRHGPDAGLPTACLWTFGVKLEAGAPATPAALGAEIATLIAGTTIEGQMSSTQAIRGVYVKFGPDETGPSAEYLTTIEGTLSGEAYAPNAAVLVKKSTALGGRRGRGRMFIPGLHESQVSIGGTLASGVQTAWASVMDAIFSGLATNDTPMYLLHAPTGKWGISTTGQPRWIPGSPSTAPAPTEVTSLTVDGKVATQRRRLRR